MDCKCCLKYFHLVLGRIEIFVEASKKSETGHMSGKAFEIVESDALIRIGIQIKISLTSPVKGNLPFSSRLLLLLSSAEQNFLSSRILPSGVIKYRV